MNVLNAGSSSLKPMGRNNEVPSFERLDYAPVANEDRVGELLDEIRRFSETPASRPKTRRRINFEIGERSAAIMGEFHGSELVVKSDGNKKFIKIPELYPDVDPRDHGFTRWLQRHAASAALRPDPAVSAAVKRTQAVGEFSSRGVELTPGREWGVWLKTIGQTATVAASGRMEFDTVQPLEAESIYISTSLHTVVRGEAYPGGVVTAGDVVSAAFTDTRAIRLARGAEIDAA